MRLPAFFLICVLVMSCSRTEINHKVKFRGTAVDYYTQFPVKNATIEIYDEYEHPNGRQDEERIMGGTTDNNGNFEFKVDGVHKNKYMRARHLIFTGPGVSAEWYSGYFPVGDVSNDNLVNAKLYTLSRIQYVFINASPVNSSDVVNNIYIERPWGQQKFVEGDPVFTGTNVNSSIWTTYYGYTSSVLHYSVTKNNVTVHYADTVLTPDPCAHLWVTDTISY